MNEYSAIFPDPERVQAKLDATRRPYLTLKAAASLDGKIATATGESKWITGETARRHGHRLRAGHAAILVGMGTVLADNPRLTVRLTATPEGGTEASEAPVATEATEASEATEATEATEAPAAPAPPPGPPPARVVLDSRGRIDPGALLLDEDGARRIVVTGSEAPAENLAVLRERGVEVLTCDSVRPQANAFLPALRNLGLDTVLVEGGAEVHGHFIAEREADELFLYIAARLIGGRKAPGWCGMLNTTTLAEAPGLTLTQPVTLGGDVLLHGFF